MNTENSFRDSVATIDQSGKRILLHPKQPKGKFYKARTIVSIVWLLTFFAIPFVKIGGYPLLLLDVSHRKFIILGQVFWPQDFYLFALFTISLILFLILFTVVYGRIFCGWVCPQTIFMEMVFRKIEYWIEGTAAQQKALNNAPLSASKVSKKFFKHLIFLGLSIIFVHVFLLYFIEPARLWEIVTNPPTENLQGFLFANGTTLLFYGVYARFREQMCTLVCPYGRLQGVLLDERSIVVSYDFKRGEPKGKISKKQTVPLGDCVDCYQCVRVCPTGIDIRNGTQLECVNCTACIDACDAVMKKVNRPLGLIRFASHQEIDKKEKFRFTPRMLGYTAVLTILIVVLGLSITNRTSVETSILRVPGVLYRVLNDGQVNNLYNYKIVNKTHDQLKITLKLKSPQGSIQMIGVNQVVKPESLTEGTFFIKIPLIKRTSNKIPIEIEIYSEGTLIEVVKTNFIGPEQ
ncbi:MAG: cytochrome c oxidase accessory protein CcoG [SAR324 cluster bacterium]|uniref:Cytochrome c oxidase accessory protein CcoG n=1 Tax=SAR324 cluster bacterium TaxID=2024889 RepID=A0A2A4TAZ1_9DELT|nr:MAG: cytochrome c oxidase accessory protein CcoG [SAR324 cluster bacterium]